MGKVIFHADFIRVHMGDTTTDSLTHALSELHKRATTAESLNWEIGEDEDFFRIESFKSGGSSPDDCEGVLARFRRHVLPWVASKNAVGVKRLPLGKDEHLISQMAFCYFHDTRTLVTDRGIGVTGFQRLAEYLRNKTAYRGVVFSIRLTADAEQKLRAIKTISKMELSVVNPQRNLGIPGDSRHSVTALTALTETYGGMDVKLIVTKGAAKESRPLNVDAVKETMDYVTGPLGFKVRVARIEGTAYDRLEEVAVDLIQDKMVGSVEYKQPAGGLTMDQHIELLRHLYDQRKADIIK